MVDSEVYSGVGRRLTAFWNLIFSYSSVGISLIRNIVFVPIYLYFIEFEEYGSWLATGAVLAQLFITDLGLNAVIIQRASRHHGHDTSRLGCVIGTGFLSGLLIAVSVTTLLLLCAPFLSSFIQMSPDIEKRVLECFIIVIIANGLAIIANIATGLLKSIQQPVQAGWVLLVSDVLSIVFTLVLLLYGYGLYAIAVALLLRSLAQVFMGFYILWFFIKNKNIHISISIAEMKDQFRNSGFVLISTISMRVMTRADAFFVGCFFGPQLAGVYSLSLRAFETMAMLIGQIGYSMSPSLANLFGSENQGRIKEIVVKLILIMTILSAIALGGVASLNNAFVKLWVGEEYFIGLLVNLLIGFAWFLNSISGVAYDSLIAKADYKYISKTFFISAILYLAIVLNGMDYGVWVLPLAMIISSLICTSSFWLRLHYSLNFDFIQLKMMSYSVFSGVSTFVLTYALCFKVSGLIDSWLQFIGSMLLFIFVSMVSYILLNRDGIKILHQEALLTYRKINA